MTSDNSPTDGDTEVRKVDELEAGFHEGAKPRADWKVGVEYEKPAVSAKTGESITYEQKGGTRDFLTAVAERYPWEPVYEGDNIIALHDGRASITLEPGGQLELSGELCGSLHCAHDELTRHVTEMVTVGDELGIRFLGLGIVPKTPIEACPWMPKHRYQFMREIMQRTGTLGHRMMQQTTTVQANFDYADEADAALKFRVAMALAPVFVAVSANSPVVDGKPSGYKSFRAHVWTDTDNDRCGTLPFAFDTEGLFNAYTQYALDVPMYFIKRAGKLRSVGGKTFRQFMLRGDGDARATLDDWGMHLTTLFPEVRLKTYIELRSADSQPVSHMLSTPALAKGLLYDNDCLLAAWDVVKDWDLDTRMGLNDAAARDGLQTRVGRHDLADYAAELLKIARTGLVRQGAGANGKPDESEYLGPLAADVAERVSPADRLIRMWNGEWSANVDRMISECAYTLSDTK